MDSPGGSGYLGGWRAHYLDPGEDLKQMSSFWVVSEGPMTLHSIARESFIPKTL